MHLLHIKITKFSGLWFILGTDYWAFPVKCDEGAYFTGVLGVRKITKKFSSLERRSTRPKGGGGGLKYLLFVFNLLSKV